MVGRINHNQSLAVKASVAVAMMLYFAVALFLLLCLIETAQAKVVAYGSGTEQVRIKYGGPTIFRFPKAVQTITGASRFEIKPANEADPSYTVLAVNPRFTNGASDVTFFLTDKSVVRVKVVVGVNDPAADSFYDFKSREGLEVGGMENAPPLTEVELLKAMVKQGTVSGYKMSKVSRSVPSKISDARVELVRIYRGSPFNGYVFKITNTSWKKQVEVDVRHIAVGEPNLAILSQSDESTLFPKGKGPHETFVRVVAKNTAASFDVVLPMEAEEMKSKGGE